MRSYLAWHRGLGIACVTLLVACAGGQQASVSTAESSVAPNGQTFRNVPVKDIETWNRDTLKMDELLTLEDAWRLVRENDPTYQAALSGRAATRTEIQQGRAAILPDVRVGYSRNKMSGVRRLYGGGLMREGILDYDSTSAYIQLQQPIFSLERYAQFEGGKARTALGEAEFVLEKYEAAVRLANAYLDAIEAQGSLELALALTESLQEQAATQDALFELNEATRVDAQETHARLARARADVIAAEDDLLVAQRSLRALIGVEPAPLMRVDALSEERARIEQPLLHWLDHALANGAVVRAANARVRVADTEERRARGRHMPTVTLAVALSDSDSENLETLSQRSNVLTVGLQLAIPIYSGGYDTANHARSRYERRQAEYELNQAREQVAAEVVRQYTALQGGAHRIAALVSSVRAGEESVKAARYGYEYGVHSNLDVLRRQDSLFEARHELLGARIAWLRARILLAAATGTPISLVFMEMDIALRRGPEQAHFPMSSPLAQRDLPQSTIEMLH